MTAQYVDPCGFDTLFGTHVPHILEKIFLSLDYESFKICMEVNSTWKRQLTSESFQKKGKSMFQKEIKEDEKKLWLLSQWGSTNEVRRIVSTGLVDLNSMMNDASVTPLYEAARNGHIDVVEILLGGGADPNKVAGYGGMAPLHIAALKGNKDVAQILLKNSADPNRANDRNGLTPLLYATIQAKVKGTNEKCYREVIQLLLDNGGDPRKVDNSELQNCPMGVVKIIREAIVKFSA